MQSNYCMHTQEQVRVSFCSENQTPLDRQQREEEKKEVFDSAALASESKNFENQPPLELMWGTSEVLYRHQREKEE